MFFRRFRRKNCWINDPNSSFRIEEEIVAKYFNKTMNLVFDKKSANEEENAILPHLEITSEIRVLDLGCGNGRWGRILIPTCKEYVGVDLAYQFIKKAQKGYTARHARFICMPAQNFYEEKTYDLILIIGLTTYMNDEDISVMAENCTGMLAKSGKLVLRSVTLKEPGIRRKVFSYKPGFLMRLIGKPAYQIIRRSSDEEVSFFPKLKLIHTGEVPHTGYSYYIFEPN